MNLKKYIKNFKDWPTKGIMFRDITPLLNNEKAWKYVIDSISKFAKKHKADVIVSPEARGFIIGPVVAYSNNIKFVPVRKPGKLPGKLIEESYSLEYGKNVLNIRTDSIKKGQRVIIVDDLLATAGTINACANLIHKLGGIVVGYAFIIELKSLKGRARINNKNILSLVEY